MKAIDIMLRVCLDGGTFRHMTVGRLFIRNRIYRKLIINELDRHKIEEANEYYKMALDEISSLQLSEQMENYLTNRIMRIYLWKGRVYEGERYWWEKHVQ